MLAVRMYGSRMILMTIKPELSQSRLSKYRCERRNTSMRCLCGEPYSSTSSRKSQTLANQTYTAVQADFGDQTTISLLSWSTSGGGGHASIGRRGGLANTFRGAGLNIGPGYQNTLRRHRPAPARTGGIRRSKIIIFLVQPFALFRVQRAPIRFAPKRTPSYDG